MQDLEIYIRDLGPDMLRPWLEAQLDQIVLDDSRIGDGPVRGHGYYRNVPVKIVVYPGAFGKRYASLLLEGSELPWSDDLEFARSAWRHLDREVRCSPGDWQEGAPVEDEKWWRIDSRGEHQVVWN